jgi:CheY-specific phosphatase CheX
MEPDIRSALVQAAASTFELLGFLVPDEEVTEEQAARALDAACRVRFRGPISGALEVEVSGPVLAEFAGNMLGSDTHPSRDVELSALGEAANIICGNVLPAIAGHRAVFDLSAPETSTKAILRRPADGELASVVLGLREGRVEIMLRRYA